MQKPKAGIKWLWARRAEPGQNHPAKTRPKRGRIARTFSLAFFGFGNWGRNQAEPRQNPSRTVAEPSKLSNTTTENSEKPPALGRNHGGTTINAHRTTKSQKGAGQNRGRTTSEPKEMRGGTVQKHGRSKQSQRRITVTQQRDLIESPIMHSQCVLSRFRPLSGFTGSVHMKSDGFAKDVIHFFTTDVCL